MTDLLTQEVIERLRKLPSFIRTREPFDTFVELSVDDQATILAVLEAARDLKRAEDAWDQASFGEPRGPLILTRLDKKAALLALISAEAK